MGTTISVPYTIEAAEGITEGVEPDGPLAIVKFLCAWSDRYKLVQDLVGTATRSGNTIIRITPLQYPTSPNLYCRPDVRIEPFTKKFSGFVPGLTNWPMFTRARVIAKFGVPLWSFDGSGDPSGVPWTTTTVEPGGEFMTLPGSSSYFTDGTPTNTPIGLVIPMKTITFTRHWMPYIPLAEMDSIQGKVNQANITIGDSVYPPETLLFQPGSCTQQRDTIGNVVNEVQYKFIHKPTNWNKFWHPKPGIGWDYVWDSKTGSGNHPYQLGDFTILP